MQLEDFTEQPTASVVIAHYEGVSERLGIYILPPETLVKAAGYLWLYDFKEWNRATELCEINVQNFPESTNVYDSLGEAYMVSGNSQLATKNYRKSLDLDPENDSAK